MMIIVSSVNNLGISLLIQDALNLLLKYSLKLEIQLFLITAKATSIFDLKLDLTITLFQKLIGVMFWDWIIQYILQA